MTSLVGFICLSIAIILNIALVFSKIFIKLNNLRFNILVRTSSLLTLISFFLLMYAYIISDFSNFNVFQNSHSDKPLIYKISGTWGKHEGAMLLWLSMLSLYGFLFSQAFHLRQ